MSALNEAQTQEMAELLSDYVGESEVSIQDLLGIMENAGVTRAQFVTLLHKVIANFEDVAKEAKDDPETVTFYEQRISTTRRLITQLGG